MKHIPSLVGGLLGLFFIFTGSNHFFTFVSMGDPPPAGSPAALFFGAFGPTGYLAFVKVCEIVGGVLLAIPKTRNIGLLFLGPIVVNILAFNLFLTGGGAGLFQPPVIGVGVLSAYLLWAGRKKFAGLLN